MGTRYDIILKGGTVVDPINRKTTLNDVGIAEGKIVEIEPGIDPSQAKKSIDLTGRHILPGIIDLHVHVSSWLGGRWGHRMMAAAGVTTALDMSGPIESVVQLARDYGAGLNLAALQYVRPGHTVADTDPGKDELESMLQKALNQGAYGLKILGGHYPLSPEATSRAIEVARGHNTYLAFHAGTLATKSNIEGFHEAIDLIGNHAVTLAHINSYCRGRVKSYLAETEEAIEALKANPHICSESYLSPFNGTSGKCTDGLPESQVTVMCLSAKGYEVTEAGLEKAIREGWAHLNMETGGQVVLETGDHAVNYWRQRNTDTTVSFPVNPDTPRLRLASAKRDNGQFVVDCIITDGGGIPRNVTVESGLCLVKLAALSIEEFVLKTSRNPARILGLRDKGHLSIGADADITVVDLERHKAVMSLANGEMVMFNGWICGNGTHMITTPAGEKYIRENGLGVLVVDPDNTQFHSRGAQ
jgi:imidazolonepropionase-like amidohydrolase